MKVKIIKYDGEALTYDAESIEFRQKEYVHDICVFLVEEK